MLVHKTMWRVAHCGFGVYLVSPDEESIVHVHTGAVERDAAVSPDGSVLVRGRGNFVSGHSVPEFAPLWEARVDCSAQQVRPKLALSTLAPVTIWVPGRRCCSWRAR